MQNLSNDTALNFVIKGQQGNFQNKIIWKFECVFGDDGTDI